MKGYRWLTSFLLLLMVVLLPSPAVFGQAGVQGNSYHIDHLNDDSDVFPNDYKPFTIPIDARRQITVAPVISCTFDENGTWHPHYHPCKLAQTLLTDDNWSDGNANYTYIFEDWVDYDWNDIIVTLYASTTLGVFSNMFLSFREAAWKNPFGVEITAQGTWIEIEWNSTDYTGVQRLTVSEGETIEVALFTESTPSDKAFIRFMIPPMADFWWQPAQPLAGETVEFDASASHDFEGNIMIYSWFFGDGTSENRSSPTVNHIFSSSGTLAVRLLVTDSDGLIGEALKSIRVLGVIGGETAPVDSTLIIIWRNVNIFLTIAFATLAILLRRK